MTIPPDSANTERPGADVADWVLRVCVAVLFGSVGYEKLSPWPGSPWVTLFAEIGFGDWFMYFTGAIQVLGAVLVLVPRTAVSLIGAALVGSTMVGAIVCHLALLDTGIGGAVFPAGFLLLVIAAAYRRVKGPGASAEPVSLRVVLLVAGATLSTLSPQAQGASLQPSPLSPRELLDAQRPLTSAEIASVFAASHEALAGKTFRLSAGVASGPQVLMGSAGLPARIRMKYGLVSGIVPASGPSRQWTEDITKIVDYTGRPARPCDGSTAAAAGVTAGAGATGELAIDYTYRVTSADRQPPEWTVTALRRPEREAGMPGLVFEMMRGVSSAGSLASGDHQPIDGRSARGFVTKFVPLAHHKSDSTLLIGDPQPNVAGERPPRDEPAPMPIQTLWIDTESLLPLRWEVTDHGRRLHHYDFTFEPIDLSLPAELAHPAPPDCIR
jgi:putative oxidoreductase